MSDTLALRAAALTRRGNLSRWAIEHPALVRFFIVLILLVGVRSYFQLGQAEDPPFTFKTMLIQAQWPGATAQEVSEQLTERIEKKLQEMPELDFVQSYAKPGETALFVNLKETVRGRDVAEAWYQVRKKIGDLKPQLPAGVQGPFFNDEFGDTFGSIYAFTGDGFQPRRPAPRGRRRAARGAAAAQCRQGRAVWRGAGKNLHRGAHRRSSPRWASPRSRSCRRCRSRTAWSPTGRVENEVLSIPLRVSGAYSDVERLRETIIQVGAHSLRLGDIAEVTRRYEDPPASEIRSQGEPAVLLGVSLAKAAMCWRWGARLRPPWMRCKRPCRWAWKSGRFTISPASSAARSSCS